MNIGLSNKEQYVNPFTERITQLPITGTYRVPTRRGLSAVFKVNPFSWRTKGS